MDSNTGVFKKFFNQFSTPILLVTGLVVAVLILILNNKYYVNYFFPELVAAQDDIVYIKKNINNKINKYLIKGQIPLSNSEIEFNTYNDKSGNYVKMPISINNDGGSQYTYSFWLNKKPSQEYADRIILLKGLKDDTDITIKNPLIKFGDDSDKLIIQFNTTNNNNNEIVLGENNNIFDITTGDIWYLVTIVFKDSYNNKTNFENGVVVLIYLNGSLIDSGHEFKNDTLKLNEAPLYILPSIKDKTHHNLNSNLSDIMYHNYALSQFEIEKIYKEGPNTDQFKTAIDIQRNSLSKDSPKLRDLKILNELQQIQ
tara:strand:- start:2747 stop:3685 length:939 start_codon:yes stop_codon:yes gene_type:complete